MDAADTLVSLAHSANSTPTIENKPFFQTNSANFIEINSNEKVLSFYLL